MRVVDRRAQLLVRRVPPRDRRLRHRGLYCQPSRLIQTSRVRRVLIAFDRDDAGERAA